MPMDRNKYPLNWPQFSLSVRVDRAGNRCECTGECGLDHGKEAEQNPDLVAVIAELYPVRHVAHRCMAVNKAPHPFTSSKRVVLTVAHLCASHCAELANDGRLCAAYMHVKAMCQRCHLRTDAAQHARNAAATRERKRMARQDGLFDDICGAFPGTPGSHRLREAR